MLLPVPLGISIFSRCAWGVRETEQVTQRRCSQLCWRRWRQVAASHHISVAAQVPSQPSKVSTPCFTFLQHPTQPPASWSAFPAVRLGSVQKPKAPSAKQGCQQSLVLVLFPQSPGRDCAPVTVITATGIMEGVCRVTTPTAAPHHPLTSTIFR